MLKDDADPDDGDVLDETEDAGAYGLGNVYFLSLVNLATPDHDFGLVKVGITKGDVERRIAQLQTGNPYQICRSDSFSSTVARHVEHWIHRTNASRVVHLEWLRLKRHEVASLVEAAKKESDRFTPIAEAMTRWCRSESKRKDCPPTARVRHLHEMVRRDYVPKLRLAEVRLESTKVSIGLAAGRALRIPGIVKIGWQPKSPRFAPKLVGTKYPNLVGAYTTMEVRSRGFHWRGVRDDGASIWASLRNERALMRGKIQRLHELDTATDWGRVSPEGSRTEELVGLHAQYLALIEEAQGLAVDIQDVKAELIEAMEDCDVITNVCSFKRAQVPVLDGVAFREDHKAEADKCVTEIKAYVRRDVYLSRSY